MGDRAAAERARSGRWRHYLAVGGTLVAVGLIVAALRSGSRPAPPAPVRSAYVGAASCQPCHPDIYERQQASYHAQTMARPSPEWSEEYATSTSQTRDPQTGIDYVVGQVQGRTVLAARDLERGQSDSLPVEYLLGSGHHGFSLIGFYSNRWVFLALSYFQGVGWGLSPVQTAQDIEARRDFPFGELMAHENARRCFGCHTTRLVETGGGFDLFSSELGVTCESCHGPGQAHLEAVRKKRQGLAIVHPGRLPSGELLRLCERCHNPASTLLRFAPGETPAQRVKAAASDPGTAKFQVFGLRNSRCQLPDGGKLPCTTCHDPHDNASTNPATYNARCMGCHSTENATHVLCPISPRTNCVTCHMPKVTVERGARFADHWIRAKSPFVPATVKPSENTP